MNPPALLLYEAAIVVDNNPTLATLDENYFSDLTILLLLELETILL